MTSPHTLWPMAASMNLSAASYGVSQRKSWMVHSSKPNTPNPIRSKTSLRCVFDLRRVLLSPSFSFAEASENSPAKPWRSRINIFRRRLSSILDSRIFNHRGHIISQVVCERSPRADRQPSVQIHPSPGIEHVINLRQNHVCPIKTA